MNKYKLVIFDLIDTLAYCKGLSEHEVMLEHSLGKDVINQFVDGGNIDKLKSVDEAIAKFKLITKLTLEQEEMVRKWLSWPDSYLYSDTVEILEYLKNKGYKVAIISNSPPTDSDQLVNLGIDQYIDQAIFSFEVGSRKPEPEIYQSLLERVGAEVSESLMIGDSMKNDINGAMAVGIDALLLDRNNSVNHQPKITGLLQLRDFLES